MCTAYWRVVNEYVSQKDLLVPEPWPVIARISTRDLEAPLRRVSAERFLASLALARYCPTTRTENVPGSIGALGFGFAGVGSGR